jgi:hypothetical protein
MSKRVRLEGFPQVGFTGKIVFPDGRDLYVKLGTGEMQCEAFVVEIDGEEREEGEPVTDVDVLVAYAQFCEQVEDVVLARLGALCDKVRARVESVRSRGLGPRDSGPNL